MESQSSRSPHLAQGLLRQMAEACDLLLLWNKSTSTPDEFLLSPEGTQKLAASCMLLESIGEGCKKIDRLIPGILEQHFPELPWKQIKGMRDHIAHGYFDIDADVIFHTVKNDIAPLRDALATIAEKLA